MLSSLNLEYFFKLTLAVYKVTGLFPESGRGLQSQIRESANQVLVDLLFYQNPQINGLLELFQEAAEKDWVNPRNFLVLRQGYGKIQGLFPEKKTADAGTPRIKSEKPITKFNNGRHKIIYSIIKEKKQIQLKDLMPSFPQVSRRTLIRDLEELCQTGIISKNGNGSGTGYIVTF